MRGTRSVRLDSGSGMEKRTRSIVLAMTLFALSRQGKYDTNFVPPEHAVWIPVNYIAAQLGCGAKLA
ncbi:hypothetical protein PROAA_190031 [Candidatus Propionivibrio aalborgensis]|uniref:Uncharacterized protein n=1 Tax=Candidatus Propionivibrio aalborgensis TaxID=1860101 RepID=A0A1A8XRE7_9RHOO|nr:hypothetical protein PROAA_190031 [Candidatus Propionivibrio aalborgensis]